MSQCASDAWISPFEYGTKEFNLNVLEVLESLERESNAHCIHDREQIDHLLSDGPSNRVQESSSGRSHSDDAQCHPAYRTLQCDPAHPPANMNQFIYLAKRRFQDDGVRSLGGNVVAQSESDSYRRRLHGRCVVDAISDKERLLAAPCNSTGPPSGHMGVELAC